MWRIPLKCFLLLPTMRKRRRITENRWSPEGRCMQLGLILQEDSMNLIFTVGLRHVLRLTFDLSSL